MEIIKLDFAQLIRDRDFEGIKALTISKLPLIIAVVIIIAVGFFISNLIGKIVVKGLKLKGVDSSVHGFVKTIVTFILKLFFILTALATLGIDVNSFIAALAAGGLTAGFGLQHSISQFASGLQILINHPFRSGDYIDIGSVSGTVREIKIMYTVLTTLDNRRVIVPNSHITESNIINFTAEGNRRIDLQYSVSYSDDIDKAKSAVIAAAGRCNKIFESPAPAVYVSEHGSSSINLVAMIWCNSKNYWEVFYFMQEQVKREFDKAGITIPFSQIDIHIDNNQPSENGEADS